MEPKTGSKGRRGPKPGVKGGKKATASQPGKILYYLAAEAQNRGDGPQELAKHLGVGYVYMTQLLSGKKGTTRLGREILVAAADYLSAPVASAYLWAGALEPTDFVYQGKYRPAEGSIYETMARHPTWGGFVPKKKEWDALSEGTRVGYVLMFEKATGMNLVDKDAKTGAAKVKPVAKPAAKTGTAKAKTAEKKTPTSRRASSVSQ